MIKVFKSTVKYITFPHLKRIMAAAKRKSMMYGHVEFEVEEEVVTEKKKIYLQHVSSSMHGTIGSPLDTITLNPGEYYHLTIHYTTK